MYNSNIPTKQEVPSTGKLVKSTVIAAVTASVLLVTVVMPAEYGIDPTGMGDAIGLKRMGEIKVSLAEEAAADRAKDLVAKTQPHVAVPKAKNSETILSAKKEQDVAKMLNHEMQVTLAPDQGTEIKVAMSEGATVNYEWWTDGGKANFDVHGDSAALKINYHSYSKGAAQREAGSIQAAFAGSHGWFWRNRTPDTITITLKTNGEYTGIKHFK